MTFCYHLAWGGYIKNVTKFQVGKNLRREKFFKFSVYELLKFRHILRINTQYWVVHVAAITLFYVTFVHIHKHKNTHRFKFFDFFGKIAKLNTRAIERNSSFLMKTSGIREILDKLSHIKLLWLLLSLGI